MGAEITVEQGSITVKKGDLHGINIDARNIPDLVPIISVAAAAANDGETVITGAERLKIKESDPDSRQFTKALKLSGSIYRKPMTDL